MALVCTEITEWIEEKVSKPVEEWEERQEQRCKKRPWYDPRRWLCWLVTILVKVVRWVVVTVGKWVVRTVCKIVTVVVEAVVEIVAGLWDVVVGIVTLDWRRILDGLLRIGLGLVLGAKATWDYVVAHLSPQCLGARPIIILGAPAPRTGTEGTGPVGANLSPDGGRSTL
ncbi:hypothetical protein Vqi01_06130 [Micromonospora qiuiae]|uniref:Uncharacterized protein n=1 Tax=Micromonospora qiuiae TaxID=502268 RepID=A0ABQ4J5L5_9ACTN|nr:hypothetical protein [Micromonospora qiuiae]GIJ25451.1 hypothetical protein Vqi01_06130 [Micromonospora qiuiae]